MKIFNYLFLLAFIFISSQLIAQDKVGYVKYTITDIHADDPAIMQQASMLKNGYMEQYTSEKKSLTVTNTGGMMITKNITDKATNTATMYMDVMGQKIKVAMTEADRNAMQDDDADVKVETLKDETKKILGYKTYKTLVKVATEDGNTTIEMWVTNDLDSGAGDFSGMLQVGNDDLKIDGVPLEFVIDANGMMKMTYTAVDVKKQNEIDASVFEIDDSGYQEMDFEQFMNSMGGGM